MEGFWLTDMLETADPDEMEKLLASRRIPADARPLGIIERESTQRLAAVLCTLIKDQAELHNAHIGEHLASLDRTTFDRERCKSVHKEAARNEERIKLVSSLIKGEIAEEFPQIGGDDYDIAAGWTALARPSEVPPQSPSRPEEILNLFDILGDGRGGAALRGLDEGGSLALLGLLSALTNPDGPNRNGRGRPSLGDDEFPVRETGTYRR